MPNTDLAARTIQLVSIVIGLSRSLTDRLSHQVALDALQLAQRALWAWGEGLGLRGLEDVDFANGEHLAWDAEAVKLNEAKARLDAFQPPARSKAEKSPLGKLAAAWTQRHPELAVKISKAVALTGGVSRVSESTYTVEGQGGTYTVTVDERRGQSSCTCPDSRMRGQHCKHRLAVALAVVVDRAA